MNIQDVQKITVFTTILATSILAGGCGTSGAEWIDAQSLDSTQTSAVTVETVPLLFAKAVYAGSFHACAVMNDKTARCWGSNHDGILGDGSEENRSRPVTVLGLTNVSTMALGFAHSCALREDGTVYCWGDNEYGQLGDGTTADRPNPVRVTKANGAPLLLRSMVAGYNHTCGITRDGTGVVCWGENTRYQLMNGTTTHARFPKATTVPGTPAHVATSHQASCVATTDGAVYCAGLYAGVWPLNKPTRIIPAPLPNLQALWAGGNGLCGLVNQADGNALACTGVNNMGQLGDGTNTLRLQPVPWAVPPGVEPASGTMSWSHGCVISTAKRLYCSGSNYSGELGNGGSGYWSCLPLLVTALTNVGSVAAGTQFTCATSGLGSVYCWGDGSSGQLGNGTFGETPNPTRVFF